MDHELWAGSFHSVVHNTNRLDRRRCSVRRVPSCLFCLWRLTLNLPVCLCKHCITDISTITCSPFSHSSALCLLLYHFPSIAVRLRTPSNLGLRCRCELSSAERCLLVKSFPDMFATAAIRSIVPLLPFGLYAVTWSHRVCDMQTIAIPLDDCIKRCCQIRSSEDQILLSAANSPSRNFSKTVSAVNVHLGLLTTDILVEIWIVHPLRIRRLIMTSRSSVLVRADSSLDLYYLGQASWGPVELVFAWRRWQTGETFAARPQHVDACAQDLSSE